MTNPLQAFWLRPRLLGSMALAVVLAFALPLRSAEGRALLGWCVGCIVYVGLVTWEAGRSEDFLERHASDLDDSAPIISILAMLAAVATVAAVAMLILDKQERGGPGMVALAAATLASTWAFVQVVFAIHYAHAFYGDHEGQRRGGLDFNGDERPDYWDFLYFSVTIGATSQTSDTDITAKHMRRIVTGQTIYTYLFNTTVLALAVNMAAGLAQG